MTWINRQKHVMNCNTHAYYSGVYFFMALSNDPRKK